jgi:hypothetical protein
MRVVFDVPHAYYLPQYAPVIRELARRGVRAEAMMYAGPDASVKLVAARELGLECEEVRDAAHALERYVGTAPDWVVFGNDFRGLRTLPAGTCSALLFHGSGTGVKRASLSPGLAEFDIRFVSGGGRMQIFRQHFPDVELVEVGFAKLDDLRSEEGIARVRLDLAALGLDPSKPTVLYAPTFFPSSIENMSPDFPRDCADFNVLIKAHDFTLHKPRYREQLAKLVALGDAPNVYLARREEYSLVPFMATADIMATDTSSSVFEFASLDKPVLTCDFVRLRWTYRGPFRYRLRRRLDPSTRHYQRVAASVKRYADLVPTIRRHLEHPELLGSVRRQYREEIMGPVDGMASQRIVNYLLRQSRSLTTCGSESRQQV